MAYAPVEMPGTLEWFSAADWMGFYVRATARVRRQLTKSRDMLCTVAHRDGVIMTVARCAASWAAILRSGVRIADAATARTEMTA